MKDSFDNIIAKLQSQKPRLDNPDEMADNIMAKIADLSMDEGMTEGQTEPEIPVVEQQHKPPVVIRMVRTVSSVASVALIMLYVWQNIGETEQKRQITYSTVKQTRQTDTDKLTSFRDCENIQEAVKLLEKYHCQKQRINKLIQKYYEL